MFAVLVDILGEGILGIIVWEGLDSIELQPSDSLRLLCLCQVERHGGMTVVCDLLNIVKFQTNKSNVGFRRSWQLVDSEDS
jgi:hypothetical protein